MIYTVTPNPSLDYFMSFSAAPQLGRINRSSQEILLPGGKGINVSLVLKELGTESCASGFLAGAAGDLFETLSLAAGLSTCFCRLAEGQTRINVKFPQPPETAFNAAGPSLAEKDVLRLSEMLGERLRSCDLLVLNGNLQSSVPDGFRILARCASEKGARIAADTEKAALASVLPFRPVAVKPNLEELADFFGEEISGLPDAVRLAVRLQEAGACSVLLSMGADGALLVPENGIPLKGCCEGSFDILSTVGAGDSMLAGYLSGLHSGQTAEDAFRLALAAGTACACSAGLPAVQDIRDMLSCVRITRIS